MRLCGDIGGTKVLLALVDGAGALHQQCRLASADFRSFADLLAVYLRTVTAPIAGGCLAVAGPVANDGRSAQITNLPWTIDCAALEARFGEPEAARLDWRPTTTVTLDEAQAAGVMKLLDALEDSDDVQNVYANFEIPEAVLARLSA